MDNSKQTAIKFAEIIHGLCDLRNREKLGDGGLRLYFRALRDYSLQQVEWAVDQHLQDSERGSFFPVPADLIRHLRKNEPQLPSPDESADNAWAVVLEELARTGPYQALELEDRVALAAVKHIGGWKKLCETDYDDLVWAKKEFVKAYLCYDRTPVDALPQRLPGIGDLRKRKTPRLAAPASNDSEIKQVTHGGS